MGNFAARGDLKVRTIKLQSLKKYFENEKNKRK